MTMMDTRPKMLIYLDDERKLIPHGDYRSFCVCRDYDTFVNNVRRFCDDHMIYIDLDHDLGAGKTGYDACKWIVENEVPIAAFSIHSMNPVGVANMRQLMTHYGYKEFHY